MSADFPSLDEMMKALDSAMPDHRWKGILQVLAIKGIADTRQLQDATGFARDKLVRGLDRMAGFSLEGSPTDQPVIENHQAAGGREAPTGHLCVGRRGCKAPAPTWVPRCSRFRSHAG